MITLSLIYALLSPLSEDQTVHHIAQVTCSECQGCSRSEQLAIIQVIKNRVRYTSTRPDHWWGYGLLSILRYPQFAKHSKRCMLIANDKNLTPYERKVQKRIRRIYKDVRDTLKTDSFPSMRNCYYFHAKRIDPKWNLSPCPGRSYWHHYFYTKRKIKEN